MRRDRVVSLSASEIPQPQLNEEIKKLIREEVSKQMIALRNEVIEMSMNRKTQRIEAWMVGAIVVALVVIASVAQAVYYNIVLNNPNIAIAFLYPAVFGTFVIFLLFRKYGEHGNDERRKR